MLSPRTRQMLNFALFAPIWTLSNVRILSAGFENEARMKLTMRWAAGAAVSWFLTTQLANYAMTAGFKMTDKDGKSGGHWTWDNPGAPLVVGGRNIPGVSENALNIGAGHNATDGSQSYIRFGKGFREIFLWMVEPLATLGGKLSLPLKWALVMATGAEPGTGYQSIDPRAQEGEKLAQRVSSSVEMFTPFAASDVARAVERKAMPEIFPEPIRTQFFGLPTRKGISQTRAVLAYEAARDAGREDQAEAVMRAAELNNISRKKVYQGWRQRQSRRRKTAAGPAVKYDMKGRPVNAPPPVRPGTAAAEDPAEALLRNALGH
jgi:hypothetical protein